MSTKANGGDKAQGYERRTVRKTKREAERKRSQEDKEGRIKRKKSGRQTGKEKEKEVCLWADHFCECIAHDLAIIIARHLKVHFALSTRVSDMKEKTINVHCSV